MLHLLEEWLRSNGLRNCPQDRPPSIVNTWSQFLCTRSMYFFCFFLSERSVDLIVEGKKSFWIDGMVDDSNAQVYLIFVEGKFFTPHGFISLATRITSILSWILGESILNPKKVLIHKNDAKAHGPKLMVI